ncbi:MAG: hypothetical protein JWR51_4715 [Devosia sp.]|uniref:hypothetical protein n=1 Tax=Devosia sp. TaxID=1871048 RepID=UPI00261E06EF|nr:hypothetical protein [Devosia sp.]MDB5531612.1 hypothetical protein [Devosia sp.]
MADEVVAPVADANVAVAHASDDIPVETSTREPLVVAKEPAADDAATGADAGETDASAATAAADSGGSDAERKKPPKLPDWAQAQLNNMAAEKRIAEREAKRLADEVAALKAPKTTPPVATQADAAAAQNTAPPGGYKTDAEFNAAVEAAAAQREATARAQQQQAEFDAACNTAYTAGKSTFGEDFDGAVANLQSVGIMTRDMLDLIVATDDPAKVLYELGSDPDKASAILALPPAKRAVEIAKLSVVPAAKKVPTPLSNAPRPVTPIDGSARTSAEPSDNDSDEVFFAKREAQLRARNAA